MKHFWPGWPRAALVLVGPFLISTGFVLNIRANVGQGPWQAFHVGLSLLTPLTVGQAGQVVSAAVLAIAALLGVRPGVGTLINILLGGWVTDLLLYGNLIPEMTEPISGYAMLLVGAVMMGLGTALYAKAQVGNGPRDSLMIALARRLERDVGPVRIVMDGGAVLGGWLMGAPVGLGTVVFVASLGPILSFWFKALRVTLRHSAPAQPRPAAARGMLSPGAR